MNLHQAKDILAKCKLLIVKDEALGFTEYTWIDEQCVLIADGYKGGEDVHVSFVEPLVSFEDKAALELMLVYKDLDQKFQGESVKS